MGDAVVVVALRFSLISSPHVFPVFASMTNWNLVTGNGFKYILTSGSTGSSDASGTAPESVVASLGRSSLAKSCEILAQPAGGVRMMGGT